MTVSIVFDLYTAFSCAVAFVVGSVIANAACPANPDFGGMEILWVFFVWGTSIYAVYNAMMAGHV